MSQPTQSDVHVNVPLTNLSIAFFQDESSFIATKAFPNVPVTKQSDRYYTYNRGDFNRDEMTVRAAGDESAGSGYNLDNTPTYFAPLYAFHKDIPDQVRANTDSVLSPDMEAMRFVSQKALIKRERIWAANYFATSKWTGEKAGAAAGGADSTHIVYWNDASSTPIEDIRAAKRSVHLVSGGFAPNKLVLGPVTWDTLQDHPDFIDRVKYGQTFPNAAQVTKQLIAELLELDEILVMEGIYNAGVEGGAESSTYIGGKHALLVHAAPAPGLMTPSAGYTFSWTGMFGMGVEGNRLKTFRMEWKEIDRVEIEMAFDLKQVSADLGYFFLNAVQ
jgi:hypothetical protein